MLNKIAVALCFVIAIIGGVEIWQYERAELGEYIAGASVVLFVVVVVARMPHYLDKMDKKTNPTERN